MIAIIHLRKLDIISLNLLGVLVRHCRPWHMHGGEGGPGGGGDEEV